MEDNRKRKTEPTRDTEFCEEVARSPKRQETGVFAPIRVRLELKVRDDSHRVKVAISCRDCA